ncbi:MAG TPA: hypothetical protein VG897_14555 [Terriglobales bacterium]|nr:hypothetical protein [Terriglobales bacterium]
MPLFSSRTKSVTFRLSAEELEALKNYCIAQRVRSVSELARESILFAVQSNRAEEPVIAGDLAALGSSLREIDIALNRLSGKISKILGPPRKSPPS